MVRPTIALLAAGALLSGAGAAPAFATSSSAAPADATAGRWRPPVQPVRLVAAFDRPAHNWLPGHRGIDLRTEPGQAVRAAGAGRVSYAGGLAGRGVVVVDHGSVRTTYEPVEPSVLVGEWVDAGQVIGIIGTGTGHCGDGDCLHLGLRRARVYLDPRLALGGAHPRLVPW